METLTLEQVLGIYTDTYVNWNEVGEKTSRLVWWDVTARPVRAPPSTNW